MQEDAQNNSSKSSLKSIGIIGSSQVITIVVGVIKMKIIAILLGPIGIGFIGLYQSIIDMIKQVTGLGLNFSAVRDIAIAKGTNDSLGISRTLKIVSRWILFTSILGMIITLLFAKQLSMLTFNNEDHVVSIRVLSLAIFFATLSAGQIAMLQGLRQIQYMAKATILGSILGFILTVPLYILMGNGGIALALTSSLFISFTLTLWFIKKLKYEETKVNMINTFYEGMGMIKLGFFTVLSGLIVTIAMYITRIMIANRINVDAVGQFQAAWTISFVYIGLILNAMATDYYPKLSSLSEDNQGIRKMINEQLELSLIMILPIITAMLSFIKVFVKILYSNKFDSSVYVLQWQIFGTYFMVVSFPLGYVLMAKNKGILYLLSNILFYTFFVSIIYWGLRLYGIEIVGISFLISYILFSIFIYFMIKRIIDYKIEQNILKVFFHVSFIIFISFLNSKFIVRPYNFLIGSTLTAYGIYYSLNRINKKYGSILGYIKKIAKKI